MNIWIGRLNDFFRYKDLLKHLVMRDIKLKYRRSMLGYLWSILDPLLIMLVMSIVFSKMFTKNIEHFPVYLFTGQIMFNYMKTSSNQAINSITGSASLIKKTYVPKYIFTFAKVTSSLIDMIFTLGALIIVMVITGMSFKWTNLLFFFPILQLYVFCIGLGMFLAQANVFFKDVQYIYNACTTAWLYLTPIFYPIESLPMTLSTIIKNFNPMYFYIQQFRDLIYSGILSDVDCIIKGCLVSSAMLFIGVFSFLKNQDRFILHI